MKTKRGISLVVLVITIIVMIIIGSILIMQTDNILEEVVRDNFAIDLTTIKDKTKEYYLLVGSLPVKSGIEYTADELKNRLEVETQQTLFMDEIIANEDEDNTFFIIDLDLLAVKFSERGNEVDDTDIFVVASNTLNVYYLKGVEVEGIYRFSVVTLVEGNDVEASIAQPVSETMLEDELNVVKSTNTWTNEIKLTIGTILQDGQSLQYSISASAARNVLSNNVITINASNMTETEKTAFVTNKTATINKLESGRVIGTKEVNLENLDILTPDLGEMSMTDTSSTEYNTVTIVSTDEGQSGVKAIYYDYDKVLVEDDIIPYYSNRSTTTASDLIGFGKITNNGVINLDKNIKTIVAACVDNAGNISEMATYTIADEFLVSK